MPLRGASHASPMIAAARVADARPVVSIEDVTHRYGKVVALDDISLEIPSGLMVGIIGPDGVGKSTLLALDRRLAKKMQQGRVTVLDGDIADGPAPARGVPAHRLHAAGPRQEPLSRAQRLRQRRLHGAALRAVATSERAARVKQLLDATGLGPFPDRPAGKLSGGMKQKVGLCGALVHDPDLLDPRRADDRRRSALAPPVLDADRRHPRRPPEHERRHLDRVHGRGAAVGLDRRDGRGAACWRRERRPS